MCEKKEFKFVWKKSTSFSTLDVRSKTTFIANVGCIKTIFSLDSENDRKRSTLSHETKFSYLQILQMMINLGPHAHRFFEVLRTCGQQHEFLHCQFVASVTATVDDLEKIHWQGTEFFSSITLNAGTGSWIVELESLATYWYNGKLLWAALNIDRKN